MKRIREGKRSGGKITRRGTIRSSPVSVVTGAAGFLGSHLVDALLAHGHRVVGVDNFLTGRAHNLAHLSGEAKFRLIRQDVGQPLTLRGVVDYVWHFASPASPSDYLRLPIETLKAGSSGTFQMLELARRKGARFLLASTSEVYGDPLVHPQREDYWGNVNPVGPRGCYDEAKRFAEALTMAFHRQHGLATRIVRIFNTYGPRMRMNDGRVVPSFLHQALTGRPLTVYGDGSQTRSFCFCADLIDGVRRLMMSECAEPVNLGNPHELPVLEFAREIIRRTESRSGIVFKPLPTDDPRQRRPDISRARTLLHWEPKTSLVDGLRTTIESVRGGRSVSSVLPW